MKVIRMAAADRSERIRDAHANWRPMPSPTLKCRLLARRLLTARLMFRLVPLSLPLVRAGFTGYSIDANVEMD